MLGEGIETGIIVLGAAISGASFALSGISWWCQKKARERIVASALQARPQEFSQIYVLGIHRHVVSFLQSQSRVVSLKPDRALRLVSPLRWGVGSFSACVTKTGLASTVTEQGYLQMRAYLGLSGFLSGLLIGSIFSIEFAFIAAISGALFGWSEPLRALRQQRDVRKSELEHHLSEMIEVVCLGLRSGLSFERSFELYHSFFRTLLARECAIAQQVWSTGLSTREEALRKLAASYDSPLFFRIMENIVRSLRFGSSLVSDLEASALEARANYKAQMQEKVAKAPIKMMIPTAALILPAMLLLVLGPVLLEMTQGF